MDFVTSTVLAVSSAYRLASLRGVLPSDATPPSSPSPSPPSPVPCSPPPPACTPKVGEEPPVTPRRRSGRPAVTSEGHTADGTEASVDYSSGEEEEEEVRSVDSFHSPLNDLSIGRLTLAELSHDHSWPRGFSTTDMPARRRGGGTSSSSSSSAGRSSAAVAIGGGDSDVGSGSSPTTFLGASAYAGRAAGLLALVDELRDTGAHLGLGLQLPTVVVCGNQSAGKSSVVEALCGVPLPRADGACTRCVTEVRMVSAPPPPSAQQPGGAACSVRLRYEYDEAAAGPGHALVATQLLVPREVPFGASAAPEEVEATIAAAQRVLLHPGRLASTTAAAMDADVDEEEGPELKFSRNVVCVDVAGAAVDLTLVDLPGIVRSVDRLTDAAYIDVVLDLVRSYISNERAIIVAVLTCKDDLENQAILHLAREVDPDGARTIGVLTKPDTIESGTHDRWLSVMVGERYALKLGYWMVKNPSNLELVGRISFDDARAREETFFASRAPWAGLRTHVDRFGIQSLRREIARLLAVLIEESLPALASRTDELIRQDKDQLVALGPPPLARGANDYARYEAAGVVVPTDNPRIEILQMIRNYAGAVSKHLAAQEPEYKAFYRSVRSCYDDFHRDVQSSRPLFAMDGPPGALSLPASNGAAAGVEGGLVRPPAAAPGLSGYSSSITSTVTRALSSVVWSNSSSSLSSSSGDEAHRKDSARSDASPAAPTPKRVRGADPSEQEPPRGGSGQPRSRQTLRPITVSELRAIVQAHRGRELYGAHATPGALASVVAIAQADWHTHAERCVVRVADQLLTLLNTQADAAFGRFPALHARACAAAAALAATLRADATARVADLVAMERRLPFAADEGEFAAMRAAALADFRAQADAAAARADATAAAVPAAARGAASSNAFPVPGGWGRAAVLLATPPPPPPLAAAGGGAPDEAWHRVREALADLGYGDVSVRELAARLEPVAAAATRAPSGSGGGRVEEEVLQVMASADAYFRVSSRRFVDAVPMHVEFLFLARAAERLERALVDGVGVLGDGTGSGGGGRGESAAARRSDGGWLEELLREDRGVAERRAMLSERLARLERVRAALERGGVGGGGSFGGGRPAVRRRR